MDARRRPTQQSDIGRMFGGRSGFVSEELGRRDRPSEQMSRAERSAARLTWDEAANHYEDHADDSRLRISRLRPSTDLVLAGLVWLVVLGGYAGFIVLLAVTR